MKLIYKISIGLISSILILILCYYGAWTFAPGSYARAEIYELEIQEDALAQIIKDFKSENPELVLSKPVHIPNGNDYYLQDGRSNSSDHWYHIYFYYPEKDQIVKTWIRQNSGNTTQFAFVSVNNGLTLGNWITVNKYFWWWKNRAIKEEFENRILKGIKGKIKEQKNILLN